MSPWDKKKVALPNSLTKGTNFLKQERKKASPSTALAQLRMYENGCTLLFLIQIPPKSNTNCSIFPKHSRYNNCPLIIDHIQVEKQPLELSQTPQNNRP